MKKAFIIARALVVAMGVVSSSFAADKFPSKPIQIICPVKAGGDTDRNTRALAQAMSKILGVPVVVANVDGG
ncbi:MAG: tripartite tricarboxylate transporter substrate binding protein, partial [Synergistaceae bacterium]|nr:tripartite tricarboxylate transporter substrate binding protein [Synergistaceae bacterium]